MAIGLLTPKLEERLTDLGCMPDGVADSGAEAVAAAALRAVRAGKLSPGEYSQLTGEYAGIHPFSRIWM